MHLEKKELNEKKKDKEEEAEDKEKMRQKKKKGFDSLSQTQIF